MHVLYAAYALFCVLCSSSSIKCILLNSSSRTSSTLSSVSLFAFSTWDAVVPFDPNKQKKTKRLNNDVMYTKLLEGCGASTPAQVHSTSSICHFVHHMSMCTTEESISSF